MTISSTPLSHLAALYKQTYQVLRESIILGDLEPGDRLIGTLLISRLQVSCTTSREAIRQRQQAQPLTYKTVSLYLYFKASHLEDS